MNRNFHGALEYLMNARSPQAGRTIQNNTRVVFCTVDGKPGVGIKFHETIVVAYLPDGTTVLNSGGWHTVTTQDRINTYSPAYVRNEFRWKPDGTKHSDYKTWVVWSSPFATTPEKPKPCRSCKAVGCFRCDHTGVKNYGSKLVCPSFEDGVQVDSAGVVVGYVGVPREMYLSKGEIPEFDITYDRSQFERLGAEHLPSGLRHVPGQRRNHAVQGAALTSQPSRGLGSVPVLSPDAQSVEFSKMSDEAQAEMDEWDQILRGAK